MVWLNRALLLLMWSLSIYLYLASPSSVPIHFDFNLKPDRYGDKQILLVLPFFASMSFFLLTQLGKNFKFFGNTIDFLKKKILIVFSGLLILINFYTK